MKLKTLKQIIQESVKKHLNEISWMDATDPEVSNDPLDKQEFDQFQAGEQNDQGFDQESALDKLVATIVPMATEKGMSTDEIANYLKTHKEELLNNIASMHPDDIASDAVKQMGFQKDLGVYPKNYKIKATTPDSELMKVLSNPDVAANHLPEEVEIMEGLGRGVLPGPEHSFDPKRGIGDYDNMRTFHNASKQSGVQGLKDNLSNLTPEQISYLKNLSPQDFTKLVDMLEKNKKRTP